MKQPPFPTKDDVVAGWIDLQLTSEGTPEYEESFWSHMLFDDLVNDFPIEAFDVVLDVMKSERAKLVIGAVAAGPVEDLLTQHGDDIIELIEREAKKCPQFSNMLGGVWKNEMKENIWKRLTAVWDRRGWDSMPCQAEQADDGGRE